MLAQRIILHETFQVTLLQDVCQHILKCHPVPVVMLIQQPQHDIHLPVAEQEILRIPYLSQPAPFFMGIDFFFIIQIGHGILCPVLIEKGLSQCPQVFGGHLILPVNQIGFGQPFEATTAFIEVGNRLHRFESETLCRIDHTQMIVCLTGGQRRSKITLKLRQQPFRPVLVKLEHTVAHLSRLSQSKIQAGHAER